MWRFQCHHRRPCPTSAAGDITDLSPSTFSYPWQLPTSLVSLFLAPPIHQWEIYHRYQRHRRSLKIHDKDYSPMPLTLAINLSPVLVTPVNSLLPVTFIHEYLCKFSKNSIQPHWNTRGPGWQWFRKKPEVKNLVLDSLYHFFLSSHTTGPPFINPILTHQGKIWLCLVWAPISLKLYGRKIWKKSSSTTWVFWTF
jgi:hypothetical protein